jgi:hypothetical protein
LSKKPSKGGENIDKMILGIFSARDDAQEAVTELESAGFDPKDISVIMRDKATAQEFADTTGTSVADGAISGATTGGALGALAGLLIGIGAITIPGIGALLIGGPLAAALGLTGAAATTISGAVTGALAGGLVGALVGLGVPEEDARVYEQRIREGGILVAVPVSLGNETEARSILEDNNAEQIRSVGDTTKTHRSYTKDSSYHASPVYGESKRGTTEEVFEVTGDRFDEDEDDL